MAKRQRALDIIAGRDTSALAAAARVGLAAVSPVYALAVRARSAGFGAGVKRTCPLGRPTVSVGNLTTGGTGKTPMVQHLTRWLAEEGHRPCILLRGYRGGDEAEEHKLALADLALVRPNPDRVAEARAVLAEHPETSCFVLDDGFQHRRARRDLDLVLLDATNPWGFGHLLPRGLMREPKAALRRADAVVITRANQVPPEAVDALDAEVRQITGQPPIAHAEHGWSGLRDQDDRPLAVDWLAGRAVMGVVAIGNPAAFADTLAKHAGSVVHCEQLPDHHGYSPKQLHHLASLAAAAGASAIVTTQKDWVKWSPMLEDRPLTDDAGRPMPVVRPELTLDFRDGAAELRELLAKRVPPPG